MTSIKYFILGNFLLFGFIAFPLSIFSAPIIQWPVVPAMYWKTSGGWNIFYTGGNIGIGKNNPTYLLDINGIINFIGFRMTTGASNNYILASDASGNARWTSTGSLFSSYVETDPLVSAWAKAPTKPSYNFTEITWTVTDAQVPDTVTINNASTATALQTARTIGWVSFNGTANINLPWVNTAGNQDTTGNAATATALQTSRTINGVGFNGTADITLPTVNTSWDQTISWNKTFNNDITVVGKVITDTLVNRTVAQLTVSGSILPNATSSQKDLGATGNRWANLWLSWNATIWWNANVTGSVTAGSFVWPLTGNASTVTNGVYTSSSYADPAWITSLAKSKVWLANVDNTSDVNKPVSTAQQTALNLKANLASPALTGIPTAPTAAVATNTTQIATTAFVNSKVATLLDYQSSRDFPLGTLIQSDIDYSVTNGEPFLLEIQGNAYGSIVPFDIKYQWYIYSDTVINHGWISVWTNITWLVLFNYGGKLCFWFPSQSYWHGYTVNINDSYPWTKKNRLVSITNAAKPGAITKEVALSANIRQWLHSSNFNSYAPTLTWVWASGTWWINITGNATTATTATTATNATRLYASDSPYRIGDASPYYMSMTYDGSRWLLQANPATPAAVRVAYADSTGNADTVDGYHASSLLWYNGWVWSPWYDANTIGPSKSWFSYSNNAPHTWPLAYFDAWWYGLQLSADYSWGWEWMSFRTKNGDTATWNWWNRLITTDNIWSYSRLWNTWQNNHYSGTDGAEYATIFYDSNNAWYYVDPSGTSRMNTLNYVDQAYIVDVRPQYMYDWNDSAYYMDFNNTSRLNALIPNNIQLAWVGWNSNVPNQSYGIYQEAGAWVHPYPDLNIWWHTWIKIWGYYWYWWIRFFNNSDMATETMSIGNWDNNVRVANDLYVNGVITSAAPTASNHVATKAYVDAAAGWGSLKLYQANGTSLIGNFINLLIDSSSHVIIYYSDTLWNILQTDLSAQGSNPIATNWYFSNTDCTLSQMYRPGWYWVSGVQGYTRANNWNYYAAIWAGCSIVTGVKYYSRWDHVWNSCIPVTVDFWPYTWYCTVDYTNMGSQLCWAWNCKIKP